MIEVWSGACRFYWRAWENRGTVKLCLHSLLNKIGKRSTAHIRMGECY
jgi:hypothetical protein